MNTTIIKIGNSKGVRIAKPLLDTSGLDGDVVVTATKGKITIVPAKPKKKVIVNPEYLASLEALKEWDTPQEDKAWAHLQ